MPDFDSETDANKLIDSYIKDYVDVNGNVIVRDNGNAVIQGPITIPGDFNMNNAVFVRDLSHNATMNIVQDVSLGANLVVAGNMTSSGPGKITKCTLNNDSIPQSAFVEAVVIGPDYTAAEINFNAGIVTQDVTMNGGTDATVEVDTINVTTDVEFQDSSTMSAGLEQVYDYNIPLPILYNDIPPNTIDSNPILKCSNDGKYVICGAGGSGAEYVNGSESNTGFYYSSDYGQTFTPRYLQDPSTGVDLYRNYYRHDMSLTGQYIIVHGMPASITTNTTTDKTDIIGISNDYGATFQCQWVNVLINGDDTNVGSASPHSHVRGTCVNHDGSIFGIIMPDGTNMLHLWYTTTKTVSGFQQCSQQLQGHNHSDKCSIAGGNRLVYMNSNIYVIDIINNTHITIQDENGTTVSVAASAYNPSHSNRIIATYKHNTAAHCQVTIVSNIDTQPTSSGNIIDTSWTVPGKGYQSISSPSGKYILIGKWMWSWAGILLQSYSASETYKYRYSNDYGETFIEMMESNILSVIEAEINTGYFRTTAISDTGYMFLAIDNQLGRRIVALGPAARYAPTTFSSLTITGNLTAGSYSTSSDYRIKENVQKLTNSYTVDNLRPVKYLQTLINKPQYGFIAHELQEHYPQLVNGEKDELPNTIIEAKLPFVKGLLSISSPFIIKFLPNFILFAVVGWSYVVYSVVSFVCT